MTAVALAMLTLVRGAMGGSERYASALTRELPLVEGVDVTAVVPAAASGFSAGAPEWVVAQVKGEDGTPQRLASMFRAQLARRAIPPLRDAEVVHFPFTVTAPLFVRGAAQVVTLHDVQHLDLPQLFGTPERLFRRIAYDRAARNADAVITVSEFTRRRAIEQLGLEPERVHVAHLGVDDVDDVDANASAENFVLYPARAWPHKNHSTLIAAVELLRQERPRLALVLTGAGLERLSAVPHWVELRGHVSEQELDKLYRRAACVAFPSLYEGFGMPPLEAMVRGCPVAVSNRGALPEVCGDAASYFDPSDPRQVAHAIAEAIDNRLVLAVRGIEHARKFTWRSCALVHRDVYRSVAAEGA